MSPLLDTLEAPLVGTEVCGASPELQPDRTSLHSQCSGYEGGLKLVQVQIPCLPLLLKAIHFSMLIPHPENKDNASFLKSPQELNVATHAKCFRTVLAHGRDTGKLGFYNER